MTSEVKDNQEFARWIRKWTTRIQQRRAPVEQLPPDKTVGAEEQSYSPDSDAKAVSNESGLAKKCSRHH